jgi:hypothetical protein
MKKILILILILFTTFIYAETYSTTSKIAKSFNSDNNSFDVSLKDQTTPVVSSYFLRSLSTFSIISNTIASGIEVEDLQFNIYVDSTNNIISGTEILLLDTSADREFYAIVKIVNGVNNKLTLDRLIDHAFIANTALCRIVSSEMSVDGSVTPVIFSARAGSIPRDITRMLITIIDNASMDMGKFGSLVSLSNGITFRISDGYNKTIFNFKNNGEIGNFCYDTDFIPASQGPSGSEGFKARITFTRMGVVLRIQDLEVIQWIVTDNLTGLDSLKIALQGHETEGEQ